jgi:thiamine-phosphate pyrophosphorylase
MPHPLRGVYASTDENLLVGPALLAAVEVLQQAKAQLCIPIVAIGGINAENGGALVTAGAGMLAVIHTLFANPDVDARARALNALFRTTPNTH